MPSLLDLAYGVGFVAYLPRLGYQALTTAKYRDGWGQKLLGRVPLRPHDRRCLWMHAVSVGEVLALRPLLRALQEHLPDWEFVISSTTTTGLDVARTKYRELTCFYYPLDFTWSIRRSLDRIRPDAVALVELELWPQFIREVHERSIPLAIINGRMSPRSYRGYRRLSWFLRPILEKIDYLAVQTQEYAERFRSLGAPEDRIEVTGSIKYDGLETERENPRTRALAELLGIGPDETVFVAGSTQAPEEALAVDAYHEVLKLNPRVRLILVPRHKERFDEVADLLAQRRVKYIRRSQWTTPVAMAVSKDRGSWDAAQMMHPFEEPARGPLPVILIDTLGELGAVWGLADWAFVGGSLSGRGGQNMMEPAAYGAAVLFGPDTWNFRETVESLRSLDAAWVVRDRDELCAALKKLQEQPRQAQELGDRARAFVLSQQGATARTLAGLMRVVPHRGTHR